MSTSIRTIYGRKEDKTESLGVNTVYEPCRLSIVRFYSGEENGRMLQLTINGYPATYIQLTKREVFKLARTLLNSFDDDIYPSD